MRKEDSVGFDLCPDVEDQATWTTSSRRYMTAYWR